MIFDYPRRPPVTLSTNINSIPVMIILQGKISQNILHLKMLCHMLPRNKAQISWILYPNEASLNARCDSFKVCILITYFNFQECILSYSNKESDDVQVFDCVFNFTCCETILGQPHNTRITHDEGTTTRNSQVHSINKIKGPTLVSACQVSGKLSNVLLCLQISFRFLTSQSIKQTHWTTISDAPFPVCQHPIKHC